MKIGAQSERIRRMDYVDCTRISHALARELAPSSTRDRFSERMSQVASTGVPYLVKWCLTSKSLLGNEVWP